METGRFRREISDGESDEELVIATMLGSMDAFDALVHRFRGALVLVAKQMVGSWDLAEDVAQEALLLAFKALPQLDDPSRFAAWLCAITRNRARRVGAKERRTDAADSDELDRLLLEESLELRPWTRNQMSEVIERVVMEESLQQLPEEYRLALELFYYDEWPVARISDFLSLPETTVKWRLRHGRELLRRQFEAETDDPECPVRSGSAGGNRRRAAAEHPKPEPHEQENAHGTRSNERTARDGDSARPRVVGRTTGVGQKRRGGRNTPGSGAPADSPPAAWSREDRPGSHHDRGSQGSRSDLRAAV